MPSAIASITSSGSYNHIKVLAQTFDYYTDNFITDTAFGTSGILDFGLSTGGFSPSAAMAFDSSGNIDAAVTTESCMVYLTSSDNEGYAIDTSTMLEGGSVFSVQAKGVVVQSSGRIIVSVNTLGLMALTISGSTANLDTTFGTSGIIAASGSLWLDSSEKLLVADGTDLERYIASTASLTDERDFVHRSRILS